MEDNKPSGGSASAGDSKQPNLWRPWNKAEGKTSQRTAASLRGDLSNAQPKTQQVIHPVKLFWPKSRCFDYLYRDAEMLLRNYPIQATICPYQDSSSDEDSEDEEEEAEKKQN
ncbi:protein ripply2 [Kryptolebias marmoratus]|uniref:Ripply transcriptional repressor 2 n=1 Tax=Kryptolebias marmoratus TaxID=37003 RepID=A0A3Q3B0P0_KRYMA|nr:protein ripply2 [Kryptolebias marmoratus]XP_024860773.1 protein ripply2 [Kryptolebias marmoratus]XP_024860774.1 protein ripply2 [Kryptolebias marmoratus]XP_037837394.1 protein ripply2 [Kryptolebias marmoratus]